VVKKEVDGAAAGSAAGERVGPADTKRRDSGVTERLRRPGEGGASMRCETAVLMGDTMAGVVEEKEEEDAAGLKPFVDELRAFTAEAAGPPACFAGIFVPKTFERA